MRGTYKRMVEQLQLGIKMKKKTNENSGEQSIYRKSDRSFAYLKMTDKIYIWDAKCYKAVGKTNK